MIFSSSRFRVCEVFGIPLYVDISFAVLLAIFAFTTSSFDMGVALALMLAISVVFHECAHSLTARLFGYETRDITVSLLGGCASLISLPHKAYQELLTAIAGPVASFFLAGLASLVLAVFPLGGTYPGALLYSFCVMNVMLGTFNLLPALPMDGGRVFKSFLRFFMPRLKATYVAMYVGRVLAVAIVVLPILGIDRLWIFPLGGSFIRIFIAYMIWTESMREYRHECARGAFGSWGQSSFRAKVSPPPYEDD